MVSAIANPFRPGFGRSPTLVVGRDGVLEPFRRVFADGSGKQWATHLEAYRGAGKTVLLDAVQDLALEAGWMVVQEDAGSTQSSVVTRLTDRLLAARDERRPRRKRLVTGAGVSAFGVGANVALTSPPGSTATLRGALESLLVVELNGVLVTVDEVHDASSSELKELGNAAQHMQRDGRRFAIVLAGLPSGGDRGPTFLARCDHPSIGALGDDDVRSGLVQTAALGNVAIADRALLRLVTATLGNPYMLQLVGYHAFEAAARGVVALTAAERAVTEATEEIIESITRRVVDDLPQRERDFLVGMRRSGSPARISGVREHLARSSQYVNVYRTRLIKQGLVRPVGHGLVDFALPGLADLVS